MDERTPSILVANSDVKRSALWLLAVVVVGALLRVQGMGDALNHDEVYRWDRLASKS